MKRLLIVGLLCSTTLLASDALADVITTGESITLEDVNLQVVDFDFANTGVMEFRNDILMTANENCSVSILFDRKEAIVAIKPFTDKPEVPFWDYRHYQHSIGHSSVSTTSYKLPEKLIYRSARDGLTFGKASA
jgi:hypothetical protein